jgi:hypothetical protein
MNDTTGLLRFIPENATHCVVEERMHRGSPVYALIAIVPDGASVPLNGYSTEELANSTATSLNALLTERSA